MFQQKANELVAREQLTKVVYIVFSLTGFTDDTLEFFQQHGIAYSEDRAWLE